jgi:hypothetical protein
MRSFNLCEECGVPLMISSEYLWLDNGDIVQKRNQSHRIMLSNCENYDPLFRGISDIIDSSIEHIVVACVRRVLRSYLKLFLPIDISERVRDGKISLKSVDDSFRELAGPNGSGRFEFVDMRYEGDENDFFTVSISEPYSVPMCAAHHCSALEAILDYDHDVEYLEVAPDLYNLRAFPSPHPEELKGRMLVENYMHNKGDIELERCGTCGGPKALSDCKWYMDRGVIIDEPTQRRVAVMGSNQIDPIFRELEAELGETLPRVAVESQRRFTKTGYYKMGDYPTVEDFRAGLALKGLGNLQEFKISKRGLSVRLDNAIVPLMIVGMLQGIFDTALSKDSIVDWNYSPEGNLEVEVTAVS